MERASTSIWFAFLALLLLAVEHVCLHMVVSSTRMAAAFASAAVTGMHTTVSVIRHSWSRVGGTLTVGYKLSSS